MSFPGGRDLLAAEGRGLGLLGHRLSLCGGVVAALALQPVSLCRDVSCGLQPDYRSAAAACRVARVSLGDILLVAITARPGVELA